MVIGKKINGYKILRKIGSGGMGEVYFARHETLLREVAIKILYQKNMAERFKNEAYIQASINHPNIAVLYEFAQIDDKACIIMEYVDGITLEEYVSSRSLLSSSEVTAIFKQVCEAMAYLHGKSIQHRDIKHSNIKIADNGTVKLLDFGIAKSKFSPKLTKEGYIIGTSDFMAPEQFEGVTSIQSDIWALGVLLYYLTTKHLPFSGENLLVQRKNIALGRYIKPKMLNPDVSGKHQRLIAKMLSVRVNKRPFINGLSGQFTLPSSEQKKEPNSGRAAFFKQNKLYLTIISASVFLGLLLWGIKVNMKGSEKEASIEQVENIGESKKIEIIVQNSDRVELMKSDNSIIRTPPFFIEKSAGETVEFTLIEGAYKKQITINQDFKGERFICNMDY